jgi:uncharacterized membrane protein YqaE (UPF0057 family)
MADDPARAAIVQRGSRGRALATRGVMLLASNAFVLPLIALTLHLGLSRSAVLVVLLTALAYAVTSTLTGIVLVVRGLQLDARASRELRLLHHGELPRARLLR